MGNLEEINQKVHQNLNNKHKEIILNIYQHLINNIHNEFCGCDCCNLLKEYVDNKKLYVKINRIYRCLDYDDFRENYLWTKKIELKFKIKNLKLQKNKLKILNK